MPLYNPPAAGGGGGGDGVGLWPPFGTSGGLYNYVFASTGSVPGGTTLGNNSNPDVITFCIERAARLRSWGIRVETAGAAGCLIKAWMYKEGASGSIPDTLVQDLGSVPGDATNNGVQTTLGSPLLLAPGWHSVILGTDSAGTSPGVTGWAAGGPGLNPGRTKNDVLRVDFATRTSSRVDSLSMTGSAPSTIAWSPTVSPRIIDVSGGRTPVLILDFIAP